MRVASYEGAYSERGFWFKLGRVAGLAGREAVELALQLYYATRAPNTPAWAKAVIYGALGYFITPLDAIPDLTPVVGYSDDLLVLGTAVATVAMHITPEVKAQARRKLERWFTVPASS